MKNQYIIMNGFEFEEHSSYVVEVSMFGGNPIYQDIFYTGFLNGNGKTPGGYNRLMSSDSEYTDIYYMKIIRKVDITIGNKNKSVKEVLLRDYPELVV